MSSRVDALLQRFLAFATAAALTVMLVVVLIVTVLRYGFHIGIFWGEELSRYAMIYMVFSVRRSAFAMTSIPASACFSTACLCRPCASCGW